MPNKIQGAVERLRELADRLGIAVPSVAVGCVYGSGQDSSADLLGDDLRTLLALHQQQAASTCEGEWVGAIVSVPGYTGRRWRVLAADDGFAWLRDEDAYGSPIQWTIKGLTLISAAPSSGIAGEKDSSGADIARTGALPVLTSTPCQSELVAAIAELLAETEGFGDAQRAEIIAAEVERRCAADATATEALCDLEEAIRLAEIGEYLYDAKSFVAGDGYHEPRELSINWEWQQNKPDTYGEGALLAEAVAWHEAMREDGVETKAAKLRRVVAALSSEAPSPKSEETAEGDVNMPQAVAEACEIVRADAANTMQHGTTSDLRARLMCRVDARKLGLVLAWIDQHAIPAESSAGSPSEASASAPATDALPSSRTHQQRESRDD